VIQPAGRQWQRRVFDFLLIGLAIAAVVIAADLAWLHLTIGPPAQRVHVRWAPTVSISERVQAEQEHGLVNGVPFEGGTWQYFLRKRSRPEIQQLLSDPRVGARHVTQSFTAP